MYWNLDDAYFHEFPCYGVVPPEAPNDTYDIAFMEFDCKINPTEVLGRMHYTGNYEGIPYRIRIDQILGLISEDLFESARVNGFPDMRWFMEMQFGDLTWEFRPVSGINGTSYQVAFFPEVDPNPLYLINTLEMREART